MRLHPDVHRSIPTRTGSSTLKTSRFRGILPQPIILKRPPVSKLAQMRCWHIGTAANPQK